MEFVSVIGFAVSNQKQVIKGTGCVESRVPVFNNLHIATKV